MSKKVVIATHSVFVKEKDVFGPAVAVSNCLELGNIPYTIIKYSLWDRRPAIIDTYGNKKHRIKKSSFSSFLPTPARYILEVLHTLVQLKGAKVYIGVDPINGTAGILAKIFLRLPTFIYYTPDYAQNRFSNKVMNAIYHFLDLQSVKQADCVWNVSSKIVQVRKKQHVPKEKNILVPNSPIMKLMPKKSPKKDAKGIVLMANFTPAIDYDVILQALVVLKKKYKNVHLRLIGTGNREQEIKNEVIRLHLRENVKFLGFMNHEDALRESSKNAIGLAFYGSLWPWTEFGDSLKARECLALGLPVIITANVSTAKDIQNYKAGFSIKLEKKQLINSLNRLLGDKKLHNQMAKNAVQLAKDFDLEKIIYRELIQKYI